MWSGEANLFVQYEEAALLWEQSLTWEKRYTAGPKLVQELSGAARRLVAGQPPGWVAYHGGVRVLMDHLRQGLGKPRVNEVTDLLAAYFKGTKRRAQETMNEYITRKTEAYMRACQALKRVQPFYEPNTKPDRRAGRRTSGDLSSWSWSRQWTPASEGDHGYRGENAAEQPLLRQRPPRGDPPTMTGGLQRGAHGTAGAGTLDGPSIRANGAGRAMGATPLPRMTRINEKPNSSQPSSKGGTS